MNHSNPATAVSQTTPKPLGRTPQALRIAEKKLYPGQPGTKKLVERYGEDLLCVRYRYDPAGKRKLKTVELIVAETPWQPAADEIPLTQITRLWIPYDDLELQNCVKTAGGKWNRDIQVWELPYQEIKKFLTHLAVEHHVATSTQNQALCALPYFYRKVLKREIKHVDMVWAQRPKRMPEAFTPEEAMAVVNHLQGKYWMLGTLMYGDGSMSFRPRNYPSIRAQAFTP